MTSITIPDSVTSIGSYAFDGCKSLSAFHGKYVSADNRCLIIGNQLKSFAPAGLTAYTIPGSVTSIGDGAFCNCSSLSNITILDGVTKIGNFAFKNCTSLTNITIPDSVTSIGDETFGYCRSLTSITIPDGITSIRDFTFDGCESLESITIPNSVTSIGNYAFQGCILLTSITIPDGVTKLWSSAFRDCTSLSKVYCKPTTPPTPAGGAFYNNANGRTIYVPTASVDAYKSADKWKDYADQIEGYDF